MHARGASEPCQGISRFTAPKGNNKFEILLIRMFSPKQKTKQILSASINQTLSLQKAASCFFRLYLLVSRKL